MAIKSLWHRLKPNEYSLKLDLWRGICPLINS